MKKQIVICALFSFFILPIQESNAQNPVSRVRTFKEALHQYTDSLSVVHYPDSLGKWYRIGISILLTDSADADSLAIDSIHVVVKNLDSAAAIITQAGFDFHITGQLPNNTSYLRDRNMLYLMLGGVVLSKPFFVQTRIKRSAPYSDVLTFITHQ